MLRSILGTGKLTIRCNAIGLGRNGTRPCTVLVCAGAFRKRPITVLSVVLRAGLKSAFGRPALPLVRRKRKRVCRMGVARRRPLRPALARQLEAAGGENDALDGPAVGGRHVSPRNGERALWKGCVAVLHGGASHAASKEGSSAAGR